MVWCGSVPSVGQLSTDNADPFSSVSVWCKCVHEEVGG